MIEIIWDFVIVGALVVVDGEVFIVKMLLMLSVMAELLDAERVLKVIVILILEVRTFGVILYLVNRFYGFLKKL